jgi:hypothetical protein
MNVILIRIGRIEVILLQTAQIKLHYFLSPKRAIEQNKCMFNLHMKLDSSPLLFFLFF